MTVDDGAAPYFQNRLLTLAVCKASIRRVAPEGSVIIGFAGDCLASSGYEDNSIVYAAVVSRRLTDGEYYSKRKHANRPDCIYRRSGERFVRKTKAVFHEGESHLEHDLGTTPHYHNAIVLLSEGAANFRYFGNRYPVQYEKKFPHLNNEIERLTQGHRVNHDPELYVELVRLKKQLWNVRSHLPNTPSPVKPGDVCDCNDDSVECDGC